GTETSASILSPSVQNSIVGIKPTVGLISRTGIIPFTYTQDTAGPMARTVEDAAILLTALSPCDEEDPATWRNPLADHDCTSDLDSNGLKGAVIGVVRNVPIGYFRDEGEYDEALYQQAVDELQRAGANVVEAIEIPALYRQWDWDKLDREFRH